MAIERATDRDLAEVLALLGALNLPQDDEQVSRADVPESVQASVEFQSACPRSATVMRKRMALVR